MQEIAVEVIGAETGERALAGRSRTRPGSVFGQHLGDQKDIAPPPGDRLADTISSAAPDPYISAVSM